MLEVPELNSFQQQQKNNFHELSMMEGGDGGGVGVGG